MSQINTKWEINGLTFELDLEDADTAERYEAAFDQMEVDEKQMPKDGKPSAKIRAYCKLFEDLYDRIFGEGSGKAILGDKANTRICNEVYDDFLAFVTKQKQETLDFQNSMVNKYSPNRAQRRAAAKK
jgi:hypothetical protein